MFWANFLHIYQPPTQKPYWINRITEESYRKIFRLLLENPDAKITMNISGVLLEFFDKYGHTDVIEMIKKLLLSGQLELTGSAKYHPLLPFLPEEEIIRQVKLNEETLRHYFGPQLKLQGFFPPEMGFSPELIKVIHGPNGNTMIINGKNITVEAHLDNNEIIFKTVCDEPLNASDVFPTPLAPYIVKIFFGFISV